MLLHGLFLCISAAQVVGSGHQVVVREASVGVEVAEGPPEDEEEDVEEDVEVLEGGRRSW